MKKILLIFFLFFLSIGLVNGQNAYRSLATGVPWSTPGSWQIRTGVNSWATSNASVPTSTDTVFIQKGHTINITAESNCLNLNLDTLGVLNISGTYSVNIYGKIRAFGASAAEVSTLDGTYQGNSVTTLKSTMIGTGSLGGVLRFVGGTSGVSRNITEAGEWNSNNTSFNVDFAFNSGAIGTLVSGIKFKIGTISSGILSQGSSALIAVSGSGFTIKNGGKLVSARSAATSVGASTTAACTAFTIDNGGTLEFTGSTPKFDATTFTNNGLVIYSGSNQSLVIATSAANTTALNTYDSLQISGSGIKTAQSAVVVNGGLIVNTGCTFAMAANILSGTLASINNNGTISTTAGTSSPVPAGKTWGSLFQYANTAGAQTIVAGNYTNLTISNSLALSFNTYSNSGTISISGVFTPTALTTPATVVTGSTINFNNPTGGQTIPATWYNNLTVSNSSGTTTLAPSGNIKIAGAFTPGSQAFINTTSTIDFNNSTGGQIIAAFSYNNLTISNLDNTSGTNSLVNGGTIYVGGVFTPSTTAPVLTVTGNTFNYNKSTGSQIVAASYYNNLTISNTSGTTTLSPSGTVYIAGTFSPGTLAFVITTSTVNFNNTTGGQTIPKFKFNNLTVSNTSGNTSVVADTVGVAGSFTPGNQSYNASNSTFNFNNPTGGQTIPGFTYYNVVFSNANSGGLYNTFAASPNINITNSLRTAGKRNFTPGIGTVVYAPGATYYSSTNSNDSILNDSPHWPSNVANAPTNVIVTSATLLFPLNTNYFTVTNVELTSNIATLTTLTPHTFIVGNIITIGGLSNSEYGYVFGGTFTITSVTTNSFSFALNNADVISTGVIGYVALNNVNRTIPPSGMLKLDGGNFNIGIGNKISFGNGSTIYRNNPLSVINLTNGFMAFGSTATDKVNITIGATMASNNEFSYLTTPGIYGTLTILTGTYTPSGSRKIVDLNNNGILALAGGSNFTINGDLLGAGTISGTTTSNLLFGGSNNGSIGTLNLTPGFQNLLSLTINRTGTTPSIALGNSLTLFQNLNLTTGTLYDQGYVITIAGGIAGAGTHVSSPGGKIVMTGSGSTKTITSNSSLTVGYLEINSTVNTISSTAAFTVTNDLTLTSGILDESVNTCTALNNIYGTGTFTGSGKLKMTGITKTISGITVDSLEIATGATITATDNLTIKKGLTLNGNFSDAGYTLTNAGNIYGPGIHTGAGRIKMTGSGRNINGRPTLNNVEIAAPNASVSAGFGAIITGTLYMNGGNITVDSSNGGPNTLTFRNNSSVIRTTGNLNVNGGIVQMGTASSDLITVFINGNLQSSNELPGTHVGIIDLTINDGFSYTIKSNSKSVRNLNLSNGHLLCLFDTLTRSAYNLTISDVATISGDFYLDSTQYSFVENGNTVGPFKVGPSLIINSLGKLKFGNVNGKKLYSNGLLVLKSKKTGTASVADVTNGGANSGNDIIGVATVERFVSNIKYLIGDSVPTIKSWRLLATPTKHNFQTIKQAWQEGGSLNDNPNPGFGTQLTSNRSTWSADGFDMYSAGGPSLKYYNPVDSSWVGVTSTNEPFVAGRAYMVFIRGSRAKTSYLDVPDTTVLREKGSLTVGDFTTSVGTAANQFVALSNPFASSINFQALPKSNITSFVYLYDSRLGSYGGYQTVASDGTASPGGGSYVYGNTYIQSSQGFFVRTNSAGAGSITFKENAKVDGSGLTARENNLFSSFRTSLLKVQNGAAELADGVLHIFDESSSNEVDDMDALKFNNFGENIAIRKSGKSLSIESRKSFLESDTIYYQLSQLKLASYKLVFTPANIQSGSLQAFLIDSYLQTTTALSLSDITSYDFSVTNVAGSYSSDRFKVVFKQALLLPVSFIEVNATAKEKEVWVNWKVANQVNVTAYKIEKSTDGLRFSEIGTVFSQQSSSVGSYEFIDPNFLPGVNYYRIKSIGTTGEIQYSKIVKVIGAKTEAAITISPNPIEKNKEIQVDISGLPLGNYQAVLYDFTGKKIGSKACNQTGVSATFSWKLPSTLTTGEYRLCFINDNTKICSSLLIR